MNGEDANSYVIKNVVEELVAFHLDDCIAAAGTCGCPRCRADITAYTLNHFPPRYVVTEMGDILVRANMMTPQSGADIIAEVMQAIKVVSQSPHHKSESPVG
ncbi:MAG: late competence development ComFB family protein [Clostridiales bacterium]|nr:late competence development ComFB family protein [Clostridiales bacterium]